MILGIPRETFPGETRVALVPAGVAIAKKLGFEVVVEKGAGLNAGFPDPQYAEQGAQLCDSHSEIFQKADVVAQVRGAMANPESGMDDLKQMRPGQILIGFLDPYAGLEALKQLASLKLTAFAMELIPRISRAQSMDALSSQANVAGYKAALIAADLLPRMFPMMMTAAGTVTPARVFVVGAGVAGLQAIATCRRLGATVQAYDIRPAVKEEVQSLGAKFVELELETTEAEDRGGYARAMDEAFYQKQREMMKRVVGESDVVISTAAVPGKKAPILITGDMVQQMPHGSVVVDLAAERGGNCELTEPGKIVEKHGVKIVGETNLPARVPYHASQMYSRNITNFLALLVQEGQLHLNLEDPIVRDTLLTRDGQITSQRIKEIFGLTEA